MILYFSIAFKYKQMVGQLIEKITVVRHDHQAPLKSQEKLLQLVQRKQVKVVRGLIQYKKIWIPYQHGQQMQPSQLPATQFGDLLILRLGGKHKVLQEL